MRLSPFQPWCRNTQCRWMNTLTVLFLEVAEALLVQLEAAQLLFPEGGHVSRHQQHPKNTRNVISLRTHERRLHPSCFNPPPGINPPLSAHSPAPWGSLHGCTAPQQHRAPGQGTGEGAVPFPALPGRAHRWGRPAPWETWICQFCHPEHTAIKAKELKDPLMQLMSLPSSCLQLSFPFSGEDTIKSRSFLPTCAITSQKA